MSLALLLVVAVLGLTMPVAGKLRSFVVGNVNGRVHIVHREGNVLYIPKDKVTRLTFCLYGTLEQECLPGVAKFTPARGCEVLTNNCACYRWGYAYAEEPNATDHRVNVREDARSEQCAVITISPFKNQEPKLYIPHSIRITWQISTYKKILPPLIEHITEQRYYQWQRPYPFFFYRNAIINSVCPESPRALVGINTACTHEHVIPYVFISRPTVDFEDAYGNGIRLFVFVALFALVAASGYFLAHYEHPPHATPDQPQTDHPRPNTVSVKARELAPPRSYTSMQDDFAASTHTIAPFIRYPEANY
jgi:hypothetical protein